MRIPRCGNCGETFEDLAGTERAELPPCPNCGATDEWGYHVDLRVEGEVTLTGKAQVIAVGTAKENETAQTISPEIVHATATPATIKATVHFPTPEVVVEDLPTEVISKALEIGINFLPPTEDGQWPFEVTGYGVVGYAGVGDRSEGLLNAMAWIEELSDRWERRLQADD